MIGKDYTTKYDRLNKKHFNFLEALVTTVICVWFGYVITCAISNVIMSI